jgi:hypothetical protein
MWIYVKTITAKKVVGRKIVPVSVEKTISKHDSREEAETALAKDKNKSCYWTYLVKEA